MEKFKNWWKGTKIVYWYNSVWNHFHFKNMCRKANKMHKMTGKRYFVVPKTDTSLMVVDNEYIKQYNKFMSKQKKANRVKKITIKDLIEMSYYCTSTKGLVRNVS